MLAVLVIVNFNIVNINLIKLYKLYKNKPYKKQNISVCIYDLPHICFLLF